MTAQETATLIWEGLRQGRTLRSDLPAISSPEDGYRTQLAVLALALAAGEKQAGWKVGLTAEATQNFLGHHERIFGYLLESGEMQGGGVLRFDHLVAPLFEPELCVVVGEPLQGPGVTVEQARVAIRSVAPAIEVVEVGERRAAELPLILAENSAQKHFIAGTFTSPLSPHVELQATTVEIFINGEMVERAGGHEVMEGAEGSVAWLANKLSEFGLALAPGDRVMTGSFTKPYAINPGDRIETRFDPFGTVSFEVGV